MTTSHNPSHGRTEPLGAGGRPRSFQSSSRPSCSGPNPRLSPALLTSTSGCFQASGSDSTACRTAGSSRTSRVMDRTSGDPRRASSGASSSRRSERRAAISSRAPSPAKARAEARPIPLLAPVTQTTWPSSRPIGTSRSTPVRTSAISKGYRIPRAASFPGRVSPSAPETPEPIPQRRELPPHRR